MIAFAGALAVVMFMAAVASAQEQNGHSCNEAADGLAAANWLDDNRQGQLRPLCAEPFVDIDGRIGAQEISAQPFATTPRTGSFPMPTPDGALWLRFAITNPHDHRVDWVLGFTETILDEVILYEETATGLVVRAQNGRVVPLNAKAALGIKTSIPVALPPGARSTFYLRISGTFAEKITPVIVSTGLFVHWSNAFGYVSLVLLVFTGTMALFSFVIFRHIEARIHRYYAFFMGASFAFTFVYDGWFSNLFGVDWSVRVTVPLIELIAGLTLLANIQYCRILLGEGRPPRHQNAALTVLTVVVLVSTVFATANPWVFAPLHHLVFFLSPMALLFLAARRLGHGLVQVKPICAALLCLIVGLAISNYFFLFPVEVTEASSLLQVMAMRPIAFTYAFAILGEGMFMMVAISRMLSVVQAQKLSAIGEAKSLQQNLLAAEARNAEAMQRSQERIKALESALSKEPANAQLAPASQRLVDKATASVLAHVSQQAFGPVELAAELGVSEKTLGRRLKGALEVTPAAFIRRVRLGFARDLVLLNHYETVAEVAYAAGFASVSHFSKLYREEFGETPKATLKSKPPGGEHQTHPDQVGKHQ